MLWVILSLGDGLPDWTLSFRGNLVKTVPNLKCVLCDIMNFKYTLGTLCICIDRIYIYSPNVGLLGSFFFYIKSDMLRELMDQINAWKHRNLEFN